MVIISFACPMSCDTALGLKLDYINRTLKVQRQLGKKPNTTAGDFPAKTFTKQEIGLKTPSSYRTIPIPDYVFEAILEERKVYEKNRRRRSDTLLAFPCSLQ